MSNDNLHAKLMERMAFMQLDAKGCQRIRNAKSIIERELPFALDKFYDRLRATPEVRSFFPTDAMITRAKNAQMGHWAAISSGDFDERYAAHVRAIGLAHARIGLEPRWYIGGYALILEHLIKSVVSEIWPKGFMHRGSQEAGHDAGATLASLVKAVFLDMDVAISVYLDAAQEANAKAEEAKAKERELVNSSIAAGLHKLAAKDMTFRMDANLPEVYRRLQEDFNAAVGQVEGALVEVVNGADAISIATREIAAAADDLSRRTEQQAASLEETTAAVREITGTVEKTANGAAQAHHLVSSATSEAEKSGEIVRSAVDAMGRIEKSSQDIGQIIGTIDEIAFQTNLLALNAGVEAARAGEAGRGFAVVASEVRALAQRSAEAAKEIKSLISSATSEVSAGVALVIDTGKALERIAVQVAEINKVMSEIAAGAAEQSSALKQVNVAIGQMDQDTQKNAAMVEETTAASHSLRQEAESLAHSVGRFQISGAHSKAADSLHQRANGLAHQTSRPALKTMAHSGGSAVRRLADAPHEESWEEF